MQNIFDFLNDNLQDMQLATPKREVEFMSVVLYFIKLIFKFALSCIV